MLELVDRGRGVLGHVLDGVLVAQPVRPLDRVVHVVTPVILIHVAKRGVDPALRRHGVRGGGVPLADASDLEVRLHHPDRGAQAGAAGADDQAVVIVVRDRVGRAHADQLPRYTLRTATAQARPSATATKSTTTREVTLVAR